MKRSAKRIVLGSLLFSFISTIGSGNAPQPEPLDAAHSEIQGTWKVTALEAQGIKAPKAAVAALKLVIEGRTLTFEPAEPGTPGFSYKLNSKTKPAGFDLIASDGPDAGQPQPGIYILQGDTLSICIGSDVRPKAFATKPDSDQTLFILQRIRK